VHDACVVEHDVQAAPGVDGFDEGLDVGFLGDVAFLADENPISTCCSADGQEQEVRVSRRGMYLGLDAGSIGDELLDLGEGLLQSRLGDVGHEDAGALLGEEDGGLKANAAGKNNSQVSRFAPRTKGYMREGGGRLRLTRRHR
jgi:hypothetical protein